MTDNDTEYQIGGTETNSEGVNLGDDGEFIPWEIEPQAGLKRLAIDIYPNDRSGIGETASNSVAGIKEAVEEGYLASIEEGLLKFTLIRRDVSDVVPEGESSEELELLIEDNGIGMDEYRFREVLSKLGRSLSIDAGNRLGHFGMGVVAIFLLSGWDSTLELYTHSRKPGEEPLGTAFNNRGLTLDHGRVLEHHMSEDEYGTRYRLILKEEIGYNDIRKWVREVTEFSEVNVEYTEVNDVGSTLFEREYGMKKLEDDYDDDAPVIVFETEFVRAVTSPEAEGTTLNLDVPVRRNHYSHRPLPWSFDARNKNDNGPIVVSDDESRIGLFPTDKSSYKQMSESRQELYTPYLDSGEIAMPTISGNREDLKSSPDYWNNYVIEGLFTEYKKELGRVFSSLSSVEDIFGLSKADFTLLNSAVDTARRSWVDNAGYGETRNPNDYPVDALVNDMMEKFGVSISETLADTLIALKEEVTVIDPGYSVDNQPSYSGSLDSGCGDMEAWRVYELYGSDVYVGVSINQKKADVAWDDNPDAAVVKLDSSDAYDVVESALNWTRLSYISNKTIDEFDVAESIRNEFTQKVGTKKAANVEDTKVKLTFSVRQKHKNDSILQRVDITAASLVRKLNALDSGSTFNVYGNRFSAYPRLVVLFTTTMDENISDYYWLSNKKLCLARTSVSVADYLTENSNRVVTLDEYLANAENEWVQTSDGQSCMANYRNETLCFHYLSDGAANVFSDPEVAAVMPDILQADGKLADSLSASDVIYIPINEDTELRIRPYLRSDTDNYVFTGDKILRFGNLQTTALGNETEMYAKAVEQVRGIEFPSSVMDYIRRSNGELLNGGREIVESLAQTHVEGDN